MVTGIGKVPWKIRTITHAYDTRVSVERRMPWLNRLHESKSAVNFEPTETKWMCNFEN